MFPLTRFNAEGARIEHEYHEVFLQLDEKVRDVGVHGAHSEHEQGHVFREEC